ncbi:MAG: PleD family two-component system response regulator [Chitinophagales bacterium]
MKRILIVDDDKDLLYGLTALLTNKGYKIKTIEDGRQTQWITKDFTPDIILLDLHLNHSDGREICFQLKRDFRTSHIPILMISGDSEAKDIMNECPADAFMAKPLSLISLYNKLEAMTA